MIFGELYEGVRERFRYDDDTQRAMAREVLREARGGKAAIISAPSVMNGIKVRARQSVLSCSTKHFPCGMSILNFVSFAHVIISWKRGEKVGPLSF